VPVGREITARFVPGEYFALSDQEQLSRPAFEERRSGAELSDTIVRPTTSRAADERYETEYDVEDGWFPPDPPRFPRFVFAVGLFSFEAFARRLTAAERVDRWRLEQRAVNLEPLVRLQ